VAHPPSYPEGSSVLSLRIKWLEHEAYQVLLSIMCGMLSHLPLMPSQNNPYAQGKLDIYESDSLQHSAAVRKMGFR
jgi:hypothetical protein